MSECVKWIMCDCARAIYHDISINLCANVWLWWCVCILTATKFVNTMNGGKNIYFLLKCLLVLYDDFSLSSNLISFLAYNNWPNEAHSMTDKTSNTILFFAPSISSSKTRLLPISITKIKYSSMIKLSLNRFLNSKNKKTYFIWWKC